MKAHPLIRALGKLFADLDFHLVEASNWHSMTFAGQQLSIRCDATHQNFSNYYKYLIGILSEHEFAIPGLLVADIAVTKSQCGQQILIEALVIEE